MYQIKQRCLLAPVRKYRLLVWVPPKSYMRVERFLTSSFAEPNSLLTLVISRFMRIADRPLTLTGLIKRTGLVELARQQEKTLSFAISTQSG